jgi:hypothetical protein
MLDITSRVNLIGLVSIVLGSLCLHVNGSFLGAKDLLHLLEGLARCLWSTRQLMRLTLLSNGVTLPPGEQ